MKSFKNGSLNYIYLVIIVLLVVIITMLMMYGSKKGVYEYFIEITKKQYDCIKTCKADNNGCGYKNPMGNGFGGQGTRNAADICSRCVGGCMKLV